VEEEEVAQALAVLQTHIAHLQEILREMIDFTHRGRWQEEGLHVQTSMAPALLALPVATVTATLVWAAPRGWMGLVSTVAMEVCRRIAIHSSSSTSSSTSTFRRGKGKEMAMATACKAQDKAQIR